MPLPLITLLLALPPEAASTLALKPAVVAREGVPLPWEEEVGVLPEVTLDPAPPKVAPAPLMPAKVQPVHPVKRSAAKKVPAVRSKKTKES